MSGNFIAPVFLIPYSWPSPDVDDYRSVVNSAGTQVIVERSAVATPQETQLYILDLGGGQVQPVPFLKGTGVPAFSNRPDWCWATNEVAFNGSSNVNQVNVYTVGANGTDPTPVPVTGGTLGMSYPVWFPDGSSLAVMNDAKYDVKSPPPRPNTSTIDLSTDAVALALAGTTYWGGMPSVNPVSSNLIAFAGQTVVSGKTYNQNFNYIYVMDTSTTPATVKTLETITSTTYDQNYQGRAPWWSPDGRWLVFESNRACPPPANNGNGMYAIFLFEYGVTGASANQVTDPIYNMNHAKWFPGGFNGNPGNPTLIVAAYQDQGAAPAWPWGLASLDVASFVNPS
jgi:Tol biopolymer transport system component